MRFSDAITRRYALNPIFIELQAPLCDVPLPIAMEKLNETSIGNMAFMAFHHPDSVWSEHYERMIAALRNRTA